MRLKIDVQTKGFEALSARYAKQLPFVMSYALNLTAKDSIPELQKGMRQEFDRPTSFTLNSLFIVPAQKRDRMFAEIMVKNQTSRGIAPVKFIQPEVEGGRRNMKRSEKALIRMGLMPSGYYIVPASGLKLNQYGNVTGPMMTKILAGVRQAATEIENIGGGRKSTKRKPLSLFVVKKPGQRLPMGIWQRKSGGGIAPLFLFVSKVAYKKRFKFQDIIHRTYKRRFALNYDTAFKRAISTAR